MKEKLKISVIVPMYNSRHIIFNCLMALDMQTEQPHEVIIVDNNSNDGSYEFVQSKSKMLKNLNLVITSQIKQGIAPARNKGISLASGEIIAFTDADCVPEENWIKNINYNFQEACDLDAIGGVERSFYPMSSTSGKLLSFFWLPPKVIQQKGIIRCKNDFLSGKFLTTFNCAFKKKMLLKIKGFDEKFSPAGEDSDLLLRAIEYNAKILVWDPNIIVGHDQNISLIKLAKKMFNYGEAMAHISKRHFANKIIIKNLFGIDYEVGHSRFTIIIFSNMIKIIFLFCGTLLSFYISFIFTIAVLVGMLIYAHVRIHKRFILRRYEISILENGTILVYWIVKKTCEVVGRIYGCFKFGVFCV